MTKTAMTSMNVQYACVTDNVCVLEKEVKIVIIRSGGRLRPVIRSRHTHTHSLLLIPTSQISSSLPSSSTVLFTLPGNNNHTLICTCHYAAVDKNTNIPMIQTQPTISSSINKLVYHQSQVSLGGMWRKWLAHFGGLINPNVNCCC